MSRKFALLEEERPIIETMAYNDKYKKILDEVWKDKVELDGKIVKEEEEEVKRIKGEALKEKEDPGAFIFSIRLEGQVNENALADTRSDINTMPFRLYVQLGTRDMMKVDRGITMINHTQAEAMGILPNVLCQVGVTTLVAKFLILDILIDRDSPIVVVRGFLRTIGAIVNTPERLFSTFDGFCHQTFCAARSDFMRNAESDSDDEEEYQIKRNKFGAPIYGPKPAPYLNCNDPDERLLAIQTTIGTNDDEAESLRSKRSRHETVEEVLLTQVHHEFLLWGGCSRDAKSRLREAASNEEIFTSVAWIRAFNINEPIFIELCHEFYSTYEFDEVCADDEFQTKKIIKFRLGGRAHSCDFVVVCSRARNPGVDSVPRVGIPRPLRASMQDLYDRMGRMEIRQEAIERMEYRQSYHWDRYQKVFEHMAGVYSVPMQGAYNPPGYAQHSMTSTISSTLLRYHSISSSRMMISVEMTREEEKEKERREAEMT
ncbi:hypothetical protein Tco_1265110 [Tanacetum coccineum]